MNETLKTYVLQWFSLLSYRSRGSQGASPEGVEPILELKNCKKPIFDQISQTIDLRLWIVMSFYADFHIALKNIFVWER